MRQLYSVTDQKVYRHIQRSNCWGAFHHTRQLLFRLANKRQLTGAAIGGLCCTKHKASWRICAWSAVLVPIASPRAHWMPPLILLGRVYELPAAGSVTVQRRQQSYSRVGAESFTLDELSSVLFTWNYILYCFQSVRDVSEMQQNIPRTVLTLALCISHLSISIEHNAPLSDISNIV